MIKIRNYLLKFIKLNYKNLITYNLNITNNEVELIIKFKYPFIFPKGLKK